MIWYKWFTDRMQCFWDGTCFEYGWNEARSNYGYSLMTAIQQSNMLFAITGEKIVPNMKSICMKVFYYRKDIINKSLDGDGPGYIVRVTKLKILKGRPIATGLIPTPGIHISENMVEYLKDSSFDKLGKMFMGQNGLAMLASTFNLPRIRQDAIEVSPERENIMTKVVECPICNGTGMCTLSTPMTTMTTVTSYRVICYFCTGNGWVKVQE